jgi:triose/dihydroxyacetone kinase / FAD-AMP lyase (cyclizing)
MLGLITSTSDPERSFLPFKHDGKDQVVLMINNLGGISELEITSIVNDALEILREQKIVVRRVMAGSFMVRLAKCPVFWFSSLFETGCVDLA